MELVSSIAHKDFVLAESLVRKALNKLVEDRITAFRVELAQKLYGPLAEANVMRQGRTMLIRRRIRKGKVQRNIRKSAVKGFTLRRGKLKRIPVAKRIRARIVQRRAARKRRAHLQQTLRKRKLSMRKRKAMGIK